MTIVNAALVGLFVWSGIGASVSEAIPLQAKESFIEIASVRLTGYNAVIEQTDSDPHITASGVKSNPEVVVARSRDLAETLPFGTVIEIKTSAEARSCGFAQVEHLIGYRVVTDTMHSRKERQIDILFDTAKSISLGAKKVNPAVALGICDSTVRVVGKIDIKDIPETQADLAILVNKSLALK